MAFTNHTVQSSCLQQMLDASNALNMKHLFIPVNTLVEKVHFINYLHQFYEVCAKPFFQEYSTLERVDCHLSDLTDKEADQFIFSGGNTSIHRRLIIKPCLVIRVPGIITNIWNRNCMPERISQ